MHRGIQLTALSAALAFASSHASAQENLSVEDVVASLRGADAALATPSDAVDFAPARAIVARFDDVNDGDAALAGPFIRPLHLAPVSVRAHPDEWTTAARLQPCGLEGCSENRESRLDVHVNGDRENVSFGALVRLGDNLSAPRGAEGGWYVFAAADAQAVTWQPGVQHGSAMRLEEKSLVGDAQAGVAIRVGGGDLAFGFVHREYSYEEFSAEEQFGGVTFAITR